MKVTLLGTSGSIATPSRAHYGGNTTSYVVEAANGREHIIDAGSGFRLHDMKPDESQLYFTHYHHDHLEGLPFLADSYNPATKLDIYGPVLSGVTAEEAIKSRQQMGLFPAPLEYLQGIAEFKSFEDHQVFEDDSVIVTAREISHPRIGAVSYKFQDKLSGRTLVSCSDFEPQDMYDANIVDWWKGADVVIADSQYEIGNPKIDFKKDWGHSTYEHNVAMAKKAGVDRLYLVHADPKSTDQDLAVLEHKARTLASGAMEVNLGLEGLMIDI